MSIACLPGSLRPRCIPRRSRPGRTQLGARTSNGHRQSSIAVASPPSRQPNSSRCCWGGSRLPASSYLRNGIHGVNAPFKSAWPRIETSPRYGGLTRCSSRRSLPHEKGISMEPELSVVIPAYNEEGNIEPVYDRLKQVLDGCTASWELIFSV